MNTAKLHYSKDALCWSTHTEATELFWQSNDHEDNTSRTTRTTIIWH